MRDRDYTEKFIFSAIKGFLDAEKKRQERAEAAKARHSRDRHGKEYSPSKPPSQHGKEYSPTSSVALYRKIPAVSNPPIVKGQQVQTLSVQQVQPPQLVQQVQTPPRQQVEPSPVQQFQRNVAVPTVCFRFASFSTAQIGGSHSHDSHSHGRPRPT